MYIVFLYMFSYNYYHVHYVIFDEVEINKTWNSQHPYREVEQSNTDILIYPSSCVVIERATAQKLQGN